MIELLTIHAFQCSRTSTWAMQMLQQKSVFPGVASIWYSNISYGQNSFSIAKRDAEEPHTSYIEGAEGNTVWQDN